MKIKVGNAVSRSALFLLVILVGVWAVSPQVGIYDAWTSPPVLEPGQNFTLFLRLQNVGDATAYSTSVQLKAIKPFYVLGTQSAFPGNVYNSSYLYAPVQFKMYVDESAQNGAYSIDALVTYRDASDISYQTVFPVSFIVYGKPNISIGVGGIVPAFPQAGDTTVLSLYVQNIGKDKARNVRIAIDTEPPLKQSVGNTSLGDISAGSQTATQVSIKIDKNASKGAYPIVIKAYYLDSKGNESVSQLVYPLVIEEEIPKISVSLINSQPADIYAGDSAVITGVVENRGDADARNVEVELASSPMLEIKWANTRMPLGKISPGAKAVFSFVIEADRKAYGMQKISLRCRYEMGGVVKEISENFSVPIRPKARFEVVGVRTNPAEIYPNMKNAEVAVEIKNIGNGVARKAEVVFMPTFPFSTDTSSRHIPDMKPGETTNVSFYVDVSRDGTPGDYNVEIDISFEDEKGRSISDSVKVPITVYKRPERVLDSVLSGIGSLAMKYWDVILAVAILLAVASAVKSRFLAKTEERKHKLD